MASNKNHKITIIDDDEAVAKMLSAVLSPRNFSVEAIREPLGAWSALLAEKPDLIILDIMMPGMSGIELCRRIRADEILKDVLIVMLSAKDSQSDRLTGLQYGADDYVTKPFHVTTLANKLEHMIKKKKGLL